LQRSPDPVAGFKGQGSGKGMGNGKVGKEGERAGGGEVRNGKERGIAPHQK